jgi:hypothetical protein
MLKYLLIFFLILSPIWSYSQENKLSDIIISIAEELAADDSDPEAISSYTERLYELAEDPVMINSAGEAEISKLFFLNDFQVKALADYVHASGKIISIYELANIPGFDKETVEMMIPFISLDNKIMMSSDSSGWRNMSITNLSFRSGNEDTVSMGSQWKILSKYKFSSGSFTGGFTVEKDPGEKFLAGNSPIPDFLSANLAYNGSGLIRKLIVGDFSARFGQGTNINTGIRTGLSLTAPGYMSASDVIKPYTSTDENNFFRGVAGEFSVSNLALTLFYSRNNIDATLGSLSGSSKDIIDNFYTSGIHNTSTLLLKKDVVYEQVCGINLSYNFKNIRTGFTWSEDKFSLPVSYSGNDPEKVFSFEGDRNSLYTIYYNSLIKRILLYGEFSVNEYNKYAFVQGVSIRASDRLTVNFLYRSYNPGYISFHGKGPGGSSGTGNEQGLLGNFTFEAAKHLFISAGCDIQYYPWLKYRCGSPSQGLKQEVRFRFLPTEKLTIDVLYNNRISVTDNSEINRIPGQKQIKTQNIKGSVRFSLSDNLTLGARVDYKISDPSGSKGFLMLQDINYKCRVLPVTLWFRYCLFSTDSWDSRIYAYENDLLYSFSIPALSGEGSRSYIMIKWDISDFAEMRIKYGMTSVIENTNSVDNKSDLKIQFRVWF